MRLAATGLVIAVAVAIGVPMYTVHEVTKTGEPEPPSDFHPPKTKRERAAATLTLEFARAMQRDDAKAACRLAADDVARALRCADDHPPTVKCQPHVYSAKEADDDAVDVHTGFCVFTV